MFIVTLLFFAGPSALLWLAWNRYKSARQTSSTDCRHYISGAALTLAVCSTVLDLTFFYSWFYNGGSPHGVMPSPGIWKYVGRMAFGFLIASVVLIPFGKGKWRLFIPAWVVSIFFVSYATFMLERD